jgi:hypothetical protein
VVAGVICLGDAEDTLVEITTVMFPMSARAVTLACIDRREPLADGTALDVTAVPELDVVHVPMLAVVPEHVPLWLFQVAAMHAVKTRVVVGNTASPDSVTV